MKYDTELNQLLDVISQRTGLHFSESRLTSAQTVIERTMSTSGMSSPQLLAERIQSDAATFDNLISDLTVGETYFFREPQQFELIRNEIIPAIRCEHGSRHTIRIWSSACASGEEAYSIAAVLKEDLQLDRSHILATDICHKALAKARAATYREWSFRGNESQIIKKFARREDGKGYLLDEDLRRSVQFNYLNLTLDHYPSFATETWGLDLILCRNVLIYFTPETIAQVAQRLYDCLKPGGWLLLGASDPILTEYAPFESTVGPFGTAYRRPASKSAAHPESDPIVSPIEEHAPISDSIFDDDHDTSELSDSGDSTMIRSGDALILEAQNALLEGDHEKVIELTRQRTDQPVMCALQVRATANLDSDAALELCDQLSEAHPTFAELHYLNAILLMDFGQFEESLDAARRALFLDQSQPMVHLTMGTIYMRIGDPDSARRAIRNGLKRCRALPESMLVPLSDGETAGRLIQTAEQQLSLIDSFSN